MSLRIDVGYQADAKAIEAMEHAEEIRLKLRRVLVDARLRGRSFDECLVAVQLVANELNELQKGRFDEL